MDANDWRAKMAPNLRQKVFDMLKERLKQFLHSSDPMEMNQLRQQVLKFEERTYVAAVQSSSPQSLAESVGQMRSAICLMDRIAASAPSYGSRGEGTNFTKNMKRSLSALPLDNVSSIGNANPESEADSAASSCLKRQKIKPESALLREIKEINQRFVDTVLDICNEDYMNAPNLETSTERGGETVVTCSYAAVALSPAFKAHYTSGIMIQPLRLLVPESYPDSSPIFLDKFPIEDSKDKENLTEKAKARFSLSLRTLSEPLSLKDIATTSDACTRAVLVEYAESYGGGTFSSKYSSWKSCVRDS